MRGGGWRGGPGVHGVSPPSWPCLRVMSSYEHNAQEEPRPEEHNFGLTPCTPASRPERSGEEVGGGEEEEEGEGGGRVERREKKERPGVHGVLCGEKTYPVHTPPPSSVSSEEEGWGGERKRPKEEEEEEGGRSGGGGAPA